MLAELDGLRPIVRLGRAATPREAEAAAALVLSLGRQFAHFELEGDGALHSNPWGVESVAGLLECLAPWRPEPAAVFVRDAVVAVGDKIPSADVWVGGEGLTAVLARGPIGVSDGPTGLGTQAAAVLAAAEVTKLALRAFNLPALELGPELVWNLVDYEHRAWPLAPVTSRSIDLGILGCGSVGTSAAAVLALDGAAHGRFVSVDGDRFDPSRNPFRYPAVLLDQPVEKAPWVASILYSAGWEALEEPFTGSVGEWVAARPSPGFDGFALASVDTRDGRLEVADLLARTTLSIGVAGLALHLQRERLGDGFACPFCDFVDLAPPLSQVDVFVAQTGLDANRVIALLQGAALAADDVARAVDQGKIRADRGPFLVGRRLADLVRESYAQIQVGQGERGIRIAAPYVSWMAGILGAAEVTKASLGLPLVDRRVDLDLLGLPPGFTTRRAADISGHCVCWSWVRRRQMQRLYEVA